MSLSAPEDAFLDVNDAHLRVYGNVHADGLKLGQLEVVTTTSTGSTIQFLHQHTAFTTTSNIEVGTTNHDLFVDTENSRVGILTNTPTTALDVNGTVKATAFDGDGALLTGIPSSAINGTLSQWTTVTGPKIHYSDGNVGIGIADPLHTLDVVGDINFTGTLREDGNPFVSTPWTIESGPTALSYTLGNVGIGAATPSAKLEVTGNAHVSTDLSVGGNLTINTISAAATHGLGAVTALSNTSADTVLLTNTGTSLVASGAVQAVSFTDGTETLTGGAWSGSAATLSTPRTIGGVSFDGSAAIVPTTFGAATFSGDVTVNTTTFHVDTTNNRVGISTSSPKTTLHVKNETDSSGTGDAFIPNLTGNTDNRKPTECLRLQGPGPSSSGAAGNGALLRFTNQHNSGNIPNANEYNLAGIAGYDHDNGWGGGLAFYTSPGSGSGGDDLSLRMSIDSAGAVNIPGPTTGAAHGSASMLYLLDTCFFKEWSYTNTVSPSVQVTFNTSTEIPDGAKAVLAEVFLSRDSTTGGDHQIHVLGKNHTGNSTNWRSGAGQPSTSFSADVDVRQTVELLMPGESDGFTHYFGKWHSSVIIPLENNKIYYSNFGNTSSTGWVYTRIRGYYI